MTRPDFPDEVLMAYADGEADADTVRSLEAALPGDADLAARLALFTGTRDVLADAAAARPPEPVPEALMASVRAALAHTDAGGNTVVAFPQDKGRAYWQPAALAASIALAVGLGAGYLAFSEPARERSPLGIALLEAEGLEQALSQLPSGGQSDLPGGVIRLIASFRDDTNSLCREFEFDAHSGQTVVAVTCRDAGAWETRFAIAAPSGDETAYAPASSLDTLEAYLMAIGAGTALSAEEEAGALQSTQP